MQPPRNTPPPRRPLSPMEQFGPLGLLVRFFYQFLAGLVWLYEKTIRPVTLPFWRLGRYLFRQYRRLWDRVVYTRSGTFSRVRAGAMIVATAASFWIITPVLQFVAEASLFAVTYGTEEIYLIKSQEIDSNDNLHAVTGCEQLPCTEANSVYYRVREDNFNSLWSLLRHGTLFYPDYVATVPGLSKCRVTSYGIRFKFAMRQWNVYPDMLEAHCDPVFSPQQQ